MRNCLTFFCIVALSGCASITGSKMQPVSVQAVHKGRSIDGASCTLTNDRGSWYVKSPGSTTIQKSGQSLLVSCTKDGIPTGSTAVASSLNGAFFANILLGGPVGMVVDGASGAGLEYPTGITVQMGQVINLQPQHQNTSPAASTSSGTPRVKYADISDVTAVPYIKESGKAGYIDFLSRPWGRAFAISESGAWGASWEWKTGSDAMAKALSNCMSKSAVPCKIYAMNDDVVWVNPDAKNSTNSGFAFSEETYVSQQTSQPNASATSKSDDLENLKQLKNLLDSGVITKQEFNAKKSEILNRM